ncbi:MAG: enoyl-ACP reductase [Bacteriovoracaceae bacterium]|nr:enoyl-ACP reductase [Bacteriovoracaceae bacterium]
MGLLTGKKALILGVANERSLAWGVAKSFKEQGAQVALTYPNEKMKDRVIPLASELGADFTCEMDVTVDEQYGELAKVVEENWGKFDILVHSIAFADRNDLRGEFSETSREGFKMACDVSAFSLIGLSNALKGLLNENGSVMAMTYYGSVKMLKNYNVMGVAKAALEASARYLAEDLGQFGVRVNCISAGAIRTLASSGVGSIKEIFKAVEEKAPLRRNITIEDVGGAAVYLGSDLSKNVTGQVMYVDSGISSIA